MTGNEFISNIQQVLNNVGIIIEDNYGDYEELSDEEMQDIVNEVKRFLDLIDVSVVKTVND